MKLLKPQRKHLINFFVIANEICVIFCCNPLHVNSTALIFILSICLNQMLSQKDWKKVLNGFNGTFQEKVVIPSFSFMESTTPRKSFNFIVCVFQKEFCCNLFDASFRVNSTDFNPLHSRNILALLSTNSITINIIY